MRSPRPSQFPVSQKASLFLNAKFSARSGTSRKNALFFRVRRMKLGVVDQKVNPCGRERFKEPKAGGWRRGRVLRRAGEGGLATVQRQLALCRLGDFLVCQDCAERPRFWGVVPGPKMPGRGVWGVHPKERGGSPGIPFDSWILRCPGRKPGLY